MNFLLLDDFGTALRPEDFNTLGGNVLYNRNAAEALAVAEVRRELAAFDTTAALAPWRSFDGAEAYPAGTRIYSDVLGAYYALQDVLADTPLEAGPYWTLGDNRLPELVDVALRLTLYHLAARLGVGQPLPSIAEHAAAARAWLRGQASGEAQALLPRLPDAALPRYGSIPARFGERGIW